MTLAIFLISIACIEQSDPVSNIVDGYLRFIDPMRFSRPYYLDVEVKVFLDEKGQPPQLNRMQFWVDGQNRKSEFTVYDKNVYSTISVYNGHHEANFYIQGPSKSIVIKRDGMDTFNTFRNPVMNLLGIPSTPAEIEWSKVGKRPWLPVGVSREKGYVLEEEIDNRDGAKCVVLSNKDKDRLWFSAAEPHRLVRREVEVELPVFRKESIFYSDYREDNLPYRIVSDITQSRTSSNSPEEHRSIEYTIKTWKTEINPNESFVVKPTDDVAILDVDSRISYQWFSNRNQPFKDIINSYKKYREERNILDKKVGYFDGFYFLSILPVAISIAGLLVIWRYSRSNFQAIN